MTKLHATRLVRPSLLVLLLLGALALPAALHAQTVTGTSGLITVPGGRLEKDGTAVIGYGYVKRTYSNYMDGQYDYTPTFGSLTFLPFLEGGFRFSHAESGNKEALGDRMLMVRVRALKETRRLPGLVIGAHDFLRSSDSHTNQFAALYAVAAKRVPSPAPFPAVDVHLGYGTRLLEAKHTQFVGVFGGVSVDGPTWNRVVTRSEALLEYDGKVASAGVRLELARYAFLMAAAQGFDTPLLLGGVKVRL